MIPVTLGAPGLFMWFVPCSVFPFLFFFVRATLLLALPQISLERQGTQRPSAFHVGMRRTLGAAMRRMEAEGLLGSCWSCCIWKLWWKKLFLSPPSADVSGVACSCNFLQNHTFYFMSFNLWVQEGDTLPASQTSSPQSLPCVRK